MCRARPIDWEDALSRGKADRPYDYTLAVNQAVAQRARYLSDSQLAMSFSAVGAALWYGVFWLVGWLIRGFMAD